MHVPPDVKKELDPYSGWIRLDSPLYGRNLAGLFFMPANVAYLKSQVFNAVRQQSNRFRSPDEMAPDMWDYVSAFKLPRWEDLDSSNPVEQLDYVNVQFIRETADSILKMIPIPRAADVKRDNPEWDYGDASWNDGTWHPEQLFTNNERNRKAGYWEPWSCKPGTYFDASPEATGPGHRYNRAVYGYHQFPRWQDLRRQPERDISETLREGGQADRRVQRPSGYNMAAVRSQPHYDRRKTERPNRWNWDVQY